LIHLLKMQHSTGKPPYSILPYSIGLGGLETDVAAAAVGPGARDRH
jgi:hypothetical protein